MKKLMLWIGAAVIAASLTGCGNETVPPAHKGKILSASGFSPDTLQPGRHWVGINEKMILIQTGTEMYKEEMTVLLADKMEITFDVRARVHIGGKEDIINAMFNDMVLTGNTLYTGAVYKKYGEMVVRGVSRKVVNKYGVDDVHSNFQNIEDEIKSELSKAFKKTPLVLANATLGKVKYPEVVTKAVEKQKERQLAIETAQNQVKVTLEEKKGQEQVAQAEYRIEMLKAKRIRDYNKMIASGITPDLLKLRALEVQEKLADKDGNTVFMPFEALHNPGAQMRMYQK